MISVIYKSILENNFDYTNVNYISDDSHAYYFDSIKEDKNISIKVRIDGEQIEVWSRDNENDWELLGIYL